MLRSMFQKRYHPSEEPPGEFQKMLAGGYETAAGVQVNPDSALQVTAVLACVRIIAETAGSLPLITYRRLARGKERAFDHYLYPVLHDVPNPEMTAMTYRETITGHVATRGNGVSEIEFDNAGRVRALWPLNPDRVRMERRAGALWYVYQLPYSVGGYEVGIPSERVFHVRWMTENGLWAMSPVERARQAIGLALATEEHGARFFSNGAEPGVVLKTPNTLSDKAYLRIKGDWEERHKGLEKSHRIAILEEGLAVEKLGLTNEDAQFLQTRQYQVAEIARIYGISLDMLAETDKAATYASVEAFGIRFVTYTMRPWFVRWEQEIGRSLLTKAERQDIFAEHLADALLRGDLVSRYQAFVSAIQNGFKTINEVRAIENDNPIEGGDVALAPLNLAPLTQVLATDFGDHLNRESEPEEDPGQEPDEEPDPAARALPALVWKGAEARAARSAAGRRRLMLSQRRVFRDVAGRVLRREIRDVLDAAKKSLGRRDAQTLQAWLDQFYRGHEEFVRRQFTPVMSAYGELVAGVAGDEVNDEDAAAREQVERFIRAYIAAYAARHVDISRAHLREKIDAALLEDDPLAALEESLATYQEARADEIARWESTRENNAVARSVYVLAGFAKLRWYSFGETCPYCSNLNGMVVGIDEVFLSAGQDYKPDGADSPLKPGADVGHPPAHDGCDCMITAWR